MNSWSLDWLKQRHGWQEELADKAQQRKLGGHLVHLFRQAVSTNILLPGDRLPAVRELMRELGISRNTAAYVYEQLAAEGYVFSRVGSGTYVSAITPAMVHKALTAFKTAQLDEAKNVPNEVEFSDRAQEVLLNAGGGNKQWGAFMPGVPDVTAFPRATYARIANRLWRYAQPENLTYGTTGGAPQLKKALADYLRVGRGVQCHPEQILITDGIHQGIDLIVRLFINPQDVVWMEEPCYWGIKNILTLNGGVNIVLKNVDDEGMCIDERCSVPKLIFTTPSHQYPLGPVMSLERRQALLKYARLNRCWIVEDDYDSEFRFGGLQTPSMQGMENNSPVIYMGTFSKTLFPGIRVGYMVLPLELVEPVGRMQSEIFRQGHLLTHLTLAEFINQGHYTKHIRKMRVIYAGRRQWLQSLILKYLGDNFLSANDSHAGLHFILHLPDFVDDADVCMQLQQEGILSKPLSKYYTSANKKKGLLIGYAAVPESEIQKNFFIMLNVLKKMNVINS